jgi:hypothetical protein
VKECNGLAFQPMIAPLFPAENLYNWDARANWRISEDAFRYIEQHEDLKLIQVFCHPKLLREFPTLLAYYRNITALSRNSVKNLVGISVAKFESNPDNRRLLTDTQALALARLFNEHISLVIESSMPNSTL